MIVVATTTKKKKEDEEDGEDEDHHPPLSSFFFGHTQLQEILGVVTSCKNSKIHNPNKAGGVA